MNHRIERMRHISRAYVRANRDKLFLFGDNLERRGFGGQAAAMLRRLGGTPAPTDLVRWAIERHEAGALES